MQAADAAYVEPDSRTNEGRGEIKQSSCFHWPVLLYGPYFKDAPICPRHPEAPWWEVIKRLAAHQLHGETGVPIKLQTLWGGMAPLAWFSRNRPHCLRRITAANRFNARTLGWTGVSLRCWSWPYREPPGTGSLLFLAPCWEEQTKDLQFLFSVVSRCFLPADHRAAATWALAFAKAAGMCLMNGYAVFKVP